MVSSVHLCADDLPHSEYLPLTQVIYAKLKARQQKDKTILPKTMAEEIPLIPHHAISMTWLGSFDPQLPIWISTMEITWDLYQPFMENGKPRNKDGTINRDNDYRNSEPPLQFNNTQLAESVSQPTPPYVPMHFSMGDGYSKDFPATSMTRHAAQKFCEWLSAQTGHFYRLPTHNEWKKACLAGQSTLPTSEDELQKIAWFAKNSEYQYQKVGKKSPNPWGLFDMLGNVGEYVQDKSIICGGHWNADATFISPFAEIPISPAWKAQDPQLPKSVWYLTDAPWVGIRIVLDPSIPSLEDVHRAWNSAND